MRCLLCRYGHLPLHIHDEWRDWNSTRRPRRGDGASMKAIVQDRYGSPDVLESREIDKPVVGDDDVLVRVHAAGVDQGVWHLMAGLPYLVRAAGVGLRAPKNP